jgi:hypothetical protein
VGGPSQFYVALDRKPIKDWPRVGASGPHKGVDPENIPREIFLACQTREGIDVSAYIAVHSTLDTTGLLDLLELKEVQNSWVDAASANAREGD